MTESTSSPFVREKVLASLSRALEQLIITADDPGQNEDPADDTPSGSPGPQIAIHALSETHPGGRLFDCRVVAVLGRGTSSLYGIPLAVYDRDVPGHFPLQRFTLTRNNLADFSALACGHSYEVGYCPQVAMVAAFLNDARLLVPGQAWQDIDPVTHFRYRKGCLAEPPSIVTLAEARGAVLDYLFGGQPLESFAGGDEEGDGFEILSDGRLHTSGTWLRKGKQRWIQLTFESRDEWYRESLWRFVLKDKDEVRHLGYTALLPTSRNGEIVYRGVYRFVSEELLERPSLVLDPPSPITFREQLSLPWAESLVNCWNLCKQAARVPRRWTLMRSALGLDDVLGS